MEAPSNPLLWVTLVTMLVGLAGSVLPGLPGVPLIFLSALVYAILTDFEYVGTLVIVLLGLFAAIALVADFVATTYGARTPRRRRSFRRVRRLRHNAGVPRPPERNRLRARAVQLASTCRALPPTR